VTIVEPYAVAARIGAALEKLGAPYFLGGSLASSLHGDPRSTNDIDLVTALGLEQARGLGVALGPDFEVDEEDLLAAVREKRSTQLFYLPVFMKVDLYLCGSSPFDRASMARRIAFDLLSGVRVFVSSPEDTVARKLSWYRLGGEVSDRQWRDVLGMLRVGGEKLDRGYLEQAAAELGVGPLLIEAWAEAFSGD